LWNMRGLNVLLWDCGRKERESDTARRKRFYVQRRHGI
jgi:hypothetical protein